MEKIEVLVTSEEDSLKHALWKRAVGYEYEEKIVEARRDGTKKVRVIRKHVPPDPKVAERIYLMVKSGRW